jgi:hypothetical protein
LHPRDLDRLGEGALAPPDLPWDQMLNQGEAAAPLDVTKRTIDGLQPAASTATHGELGTGSVLPPLPVAAVTVQAGSDVHVLVHTLKTCLCAVCMNEPVAGDGASMRACCVIGAHGASSWCRVPFRPTKE